MNNVRDVRKDSSWTTGQPMMQSKNQSTEEFNKKIKILES